jgi:hypothetical protein
VPPKIVLDSYVLSCPDPAKGRESVLSYVRQLLDWRDLRDATWLETFLSEDTFDLLAKTDGYPPWNLLETCLDQQDLDLQPRDVLEILNAIMSKTPSVEEHLNLKGIQFESVKTSHTELFVERAECFVEHFQKLLLLACLLRKTEARCWLGTTGFPSGPRTDVNVEAEAVLHREEDSEMVQEDITGTIPVVTNFQSLLDEFDPVDLWLAAETHANRQFALNIVITRSMRNAVDSVCRDWKFGTHFFDSADKHGFLSQAPKSRMLLRACAETVLRLNMFATHALRSGPGPGDPQLRRGCDRAWRRDIDREFHLHYWETVNGPELACVVQHNDMTIPM